MWKEIVWDVKIESVWGKIKFLNIYIIKIMKVVMVIMKFKIWICLNEYIFICIVLFKFWNLFLDKVNGIFLFID